MKRFILMASLFVVLSGCSGILRFCDWDSKGHLDSALMTNGEVLERDVNGLINSINENELSGRLWITSMFIGNGKSLKGSMSAGQRCWYRWEVSERVFGERDYFLRSLYVSIMFEERGIIKDEFLFKKTIKFLIL